MYQPSCNVHYFSAAIVPIIHVKCNTVVKYMYQPSSNVHYFSAAIVPIIHVKCNTVVKYCSEVHVPTIM